MFWNQVTTDFWHIMPVTQRHQWHMLCCCFSQSLIFFYSLMSGIFSKDEKFLPFSSSNSVGPVNVLFPIRTLPDSKWGPSNFASLHNFVNICDGFCGSRHWLYPKLENIGVIYNFKNGEIVLTLQIADWIHKLLDVLNKICFLNRFLFHR